MGHLENVCLSSSAGNVDGKATGTNDPILSVTNFLLEKVFAVKVNDNQIWKIDCHLWTMRADNKRVISAIPTKDKCCKVI